MYLTLGEVGDIFAFMMTIALLESLVVTGILVLLSAALPRNWLKDGFAFKGFLALLVTIATALLFQKLLTDDYPSQWMLLAFSTIPWLVIALLILFVRNKPRIQNLLLNIQDRMLIMLFIYVPIGLFALLVVLYRNLL